MDGRGVKMVLSLLTVTYSKAIAAALSAANSKAFSKSISKAI